MDPYRVGRFTVDRNQRLGGGAFGQVYVAEDSRGQTLAAKEIWVGNLDPDHKRRVELEIAAHRNIAPHPNIIRYVDSVTKGPYTWLFTEKCKDGNLDEYFTKNDVTLAQKFDLLLQITRGVHHLHHLEPPHVHRDLKPLNVLVQNDEENHFPSQAASGDIETIEIENQLAVARIMVPSRRHFPSPPPAAQASARRLDDHHVADTRIVAPLMTAARPERPPQARRYAEGRRTDRRLTLTIIGGDTATDGGFDDTISTSCWRQTAASSSGWLQFTSLPQKLANPAVCATSRGMFLSGGWAGKRQVRTCHLFEPGTGRWRRLADMPTARSEAAAVTMGDMVVVLGGSVGHEEYNNLQILEDVEAFDFDSNSWVVLKPMKQEMTQPICTIINSHIHVLFEDNPDNNAVHLGAKISLQRYDSGRDRWSFGPSLPRDFGRTWGARAVAVGSTMLVAGGVDGICASYDTDTKTWSKLSPCLHKHNYGSLVVSAGRVILAGGDNGDELTDVIEEYDVGRNRWAECGTRLPMPLGSHHAVMLDLSDMS